MVENNNLSIFLDDLCQEERHSSVDYLVMVVALCMHDVTYLDDLDLLFDEIGKQNGVEASVVRNAVNGCLYQTCFHSKLSELQQAVFGVDKVGFVSTNSFLRQIVFYLQKEQKRKQKKLHM